MIIIDLGFQPAPRLPVLPTLKPGRQEPKKQIDRDILTVLWDAPEPIGTWTLIAQVAELYPAKTRMECRTVRKEILSRINPLIRDRLVRRMGRSHLTLG